jgi:hypothetical protein
MEIRRWLEQYLLVFPTNFFPIMGQQVTLTEDNGEAVGSRIDLLLQRADLGECDLVARKSNNPDMGYLYLGGGTFKADEAAKDPLTDEQLRNKANSGNTITYTCVPPGSGNRMALDRDEDGALDGDELSLGTDPADATSVPVI